MTTIAGASQYLNASTYANLTGRASQGTSLISSLGTVDLLDIARSNSSSGIGLSSRARALNKQFLNSTSSNYNSLFSSTNSAYLSIEQLQQQVLALRASLPGSSISDNARSLSSEETEEGVALDKTSDNLLGNNVDIEA